jgi:hypothetical protein
MRKPTLLGTATLFMSLLTQAATAQTSIWPDGTVISKNGVTTKYKLCNEGKIEVRYATAIRSGNSFFGYSWDLVGWYPILPGKCDDAYHGSDKDPDEPIYIAMAFKDSTGVWGAPTFPKPGELRGHEGMDGIADIDTKLCVAEDYFKYHLNGNINLPCQSGYFPIKAALYLEPMTRQCHQYPGQPMYCSGALYNFTFEMDDDSRAVAAGPSNGKRVAQPNSSKEDLQSNHSDNDNTALSAAAGLAGAVIVGAIIKEFIDSSRCNTPVPKPFEKGTLNAAINREPVVRRTCKGANWYMRYKDGRTSTVGERIAISDRSVGSVLDPPQQVDDNNTRTPDSAQALEVQSIINTIDRILGSRGRTTVTTYGKFRYKADSDEVNEVWVNLVALDLSMATVEAPATRSEPSRLSIPCVDDTDCALYLFRKEGYIKGFPSVQLYLQGQGTWQEVLSQLNNLKAIFPKPPVVRAQ